MIERIRDQYQGRNKSSAYKDLGPVNTIESNLIELGTDKSRIISAQVFITNMEDKPRMDEVWKQWIGDDPQYWPQRACLGVQLEGDNLIEVTVVAIRENG